MPKYKGKPTAYLDQNILDMFVKYGMGDFGRKLIENYQIIYSNETLKEIKRSTGFEEKFLSLLNDLKAYHLKVVLKQPGFIVTDQATITNRDTSQVYDEYCQNVVSYGNIENAMQQWVFKFSGGRVGESISDIHAEQLEAFSDLIDGMVNNAKTLPNRPRELVANYSKLMIDQCRSILKELETLTKKDIPDSKNWNGIREFRKALKVGPRELNNIKPPNILQKIWDVYKILLPNNEYIKDLEDFFRLKVNPIYPDRPYYKHEKVAGIYNMLNTIGYYPDANINKKRRFVASMSDNGHASLASFCDTLLSRDKNFLKKVAAAYEYLQIPTNVKHVVVDYA
jgi:hypothetical protein